MHYLLVTNWQKNLLSCNGKNLPQLTFARMEVEMIANILLADPVIGARATKDEVLRRLQHVALIHNVACKWLYENW